MSHLGLPAFMLSGDWSPDPIPIITPIKYRFFHSVPNVCPCDSAVDLFKVFIDENLVQKWVYHTNQYSMIHLGKSLDTTVDELYRLIGCLIYMGIDNLPEIQDYFYGQFERQFLMDCFQYNRFSQLLSCFCVTDPRDHDTFKDPADHCNQLINYLNQKFQSHYNLTQHLSLDEAMVAFKGYAAIKQYIPSKPHRFGYKIWCLCCQGYLYRFELYEGADEEIFEETSVTVETVRRLMEGLDDQDYIVYTDNYFTSPKLLRELATRGIAACGAVKSNRSGMPRIDGWNAERWNRGEYRILRQNDMALAVWKDRKLLRILFNHLINPTETTTVDRSEHGGQNVQLQCPKAVDDYFHNSRFVDVIGQLHYSYLLGRKAERAAPRLIWWLIDMAILNAYKLWSLRGNGENHREFREMLMNELVTSSGVAPSPSVITSAVSDLSCIMHYSIYTPDKRYCAECPQGSENPHQTNYVCKACNIHLCVGECFAIYHKRKCQ